MSESVVGQGESLVSAPSSSARADGTVGAPRCRPKKAFPLLNYTYALRTSITVIRKAEKMRLREILKIRSLARMYQR